MTGTDPAGRCMQVEVGYCSVDEPLSSPGPQLTPDGRLGSHFACARDVAFTPSRQSINTIDRATIDA